MKLIVGLGNPGSRYEKTRHNIGFLVIDALIQESQLKTSFKFKSQIAQTVWGKEPVILLKPDTYMNLSGEPIRLVMEYFSIDAQDVLIIYDDLDLALGQIRLREKGGAGGHNGIKSVIQNLKTEQFPRCRIGIDKNPMIEAKDYVLGRFSNGDFVIIQDLMPRLMSMCHDFIDKKFVDVMTKYNTKT